MERVGITQTQADFVESCKEYELDQWGVLDNASADCHIEVIELVRDKPLDLLIAYKYGYFIRELGDRGC